jgi:hypothetical protein
MVEGKAIEAPPNKIRRNGPANVVAARGSFRPPAAPLVDDHAETFLIHHRG